jgi:hypothetical protein
VHFSFSTTSKVNLHQNYHSELPLLHHDRTTNIPYNHPETMIKRNRNANSIFFGIIHSNANEISVIQDYDEKA